MKTKIVINLFLLILFLPGCFSIDSKDENNIEEKSNYIPGNLPINYYADKTVKSLEIPPDLTSPNAQNSFRISEFADNVKENVIDFSGSEKSKDDTLKITRKTSNIEVKKSGNRRWLIVEKDPDTVWELSKDFFKQKGFVIKKSDKKLGILETDFLENFAEIPKKNIGFIRQYLQEALKARYSLPIIDKYRIRLEPKNNSSTEVYLSLFSMQEKLSSSGNIESTIWEVYPKDESLETEMLYQLMLFLGGDQALAKEKIIEAKDQEKINSEIVNNFNGYAKLRINLPILESWDVINWSLDQINVDIDDKDIKERSFYIKTVRSSDLGILSSLLGTEAITRTFQLVLKEYDKGVTELFFNDVLGENEQETKDFSFEFLNRIKNTL